MRVSDELLLLLLLRGHVRMNGRLSLFTLLYQRGHHPTWMVASLPFSAVTSAVI